MVTASAAALPQEAAAAEWLFTAPLPQLLEWRILLIAVVVVNRISRSSSINTRERGKITVVVPSASQPRPCNFSAGCLAHMSPAWLHRHACAPLSASHSTKCVLDLSVNMAKICVM